MIIESSAREILEIGSGANPTLLADIVVKNNLSYTTNDIDQNEAKKRMMPF